MLTLGVLGMDVLGVDVPIRSCLSLQDAAQRTQFCSFVNHLFEQIADMKTAHTSANKKYALASVAPSRCVWITQYV